MQVSHETTWEFVHLAHGFQLLNQSSNEKKSSSWEEWRRSWQEGAFVHCAPPPCHETSRHAYPVQNLQHLFWYLLISPCKTKRGKHSLHILHASTTGWQGKIEIEADTQQDQQWSDGWLLSIKAVISTTLTPCDHAWSLNLAGELAFLWDYLHI